MKFYRDEDVFDSKTQYLNNDLTLTDRSWICDCGIAHNRDKNAAINIRNFGIRTAGITGIAQECLQQ